MPSAIAVLPAPPLALAMLPAPSANAKSPVPEVAVAVPSWNTVMPSIERDMLLKSNDEAESAAAGRARPPRSIDDAASVDGSAIATHGIAAIADPIPIPSANPPTRPRNFLRSI